MLDFIEKALPDWIKSNEGSDIRKRAALDWMKSNEGDGALAKGVFDQATEDSRRVFPVGRWFREGMSQFGRRDPRRGLPDQAAGSRQQASGDAFF